jgi:hypothetical protein
VIDRAHDREHYGLEVTPVRLYAQVTPLRIVTAEEGACGVEADLRFVEQVGVLEKWLPYGFRDAGGLGSN